MIDTLAALSDSSSPGMFISNIQYSFARWQAVRLDEMCLGTHSWPYLPGEPNNGVPCVEASIVGTDFFKAWSVLLADVSSQDDNATTVSRMTNNGIKRFINLLFFNAIHQRIHTIRQQQ